MAEGILSTEKALGKKPGKYKDDETIHVQIEDESTLRADLGYLASKMGIDIEQLKKERREAERQATEEKQNAKIEKHERAAKLREKKLEDLFLKEYGERFFLTLNGIRLKKVTNLDNFKCHECGEPIIIRGCCQSIAEIPADFVSYTSNPLSKWVAAPALLMDAKCKNKHINQILIQQLLG